MSKRDNITKKYMSDPHRFADFFNGYIYNGKEVISPNSLSEVDTAGVAVIPYFINNTSNKTGKTTKSLAVKKYRDILKKAVLMKSDKVYYLFLGIENQTDIHYAMPVRNMLYDGLLYNQQIETIAKYNRNNGICESSGEFLSGFTKNDKLIPIVTVTVYWGTKPWDAPITLKDMLLENIDENIASMIGDYHCNLFSIIDAEKLPKYKTELNELFNLLRMRNDGEGMRELVENNIAYKNIDEETAGMMSEFANIELPGKRKDGGYDMCKAVLDLKNEGRMEGIEEGREEGRKEGRKEGREETLAEKIIVKLKKGKSIFTIVDEIEETEEYVRELIDKYNL